LYIAIFDKRNFKLINKFGGQLKIKSPGVRYVSDLKADGNGRFYILSTWDGGKVMVCDSRGQLKKFIGARGVLPGKFREPVLIGFDGEDNIYILDGKNKRIEKFTPKNQTRIKKDLTPKITPRVKSETEYINEIIKNPHYESYLEFIAKYPKNPRRIELLNIVKSNNPNLPNEAYWNNMIENSKGYYEIEHKNIEMVWIPSGKYSIGDNINSVRKEIFSNGFWIGKFEISIEQYRAFSNAKNVNLPNIAFKPRDPIRGINWYEAKEFCGWVGCRLPKEVEWEIAARGKTNFANYPWGENYSSIHANLNSNSVQKIGSLQENGFGLHNIIGNVEEWCEDSYKNNRFRILKGGSFENTPDEVTITRRNYIFPKTGMPTYGVRVAKD
jgi:serine/threonine-protein kinase